MVIHDLNYVEELLKAGLIQGPVLEMGTGYEGETCRQLIEKANLKYVGTDMMAGPHVDVIADFEKSDDMAKFADVGKIWHGADTQRSRAHVRSHSHPG